MTSSIIPSKDTFKNLNNHPTSTPPPSTSTTSSMDDPHSIIFVDTAEKHITTSPPRSPPSSPAAGSLAAASSSYVPPISPIFPNRNTRAQSQTVIQHPMYYNHRYELQQQPSFMLHREIIPYPPQLPLFSPPLTHSPEELGTSENAFERQFAQQTPPTQKQAQSEEKGMTTSKAEKGKDNPPENPEGQTGQPKNTDKKSPEDKENEETTTTSSPTNSSSNVKPQTSLSESTQSPESTTPSHPVLDNLSFVTPRLSSDSATSNYDGPQPLNGKLNIGAEDKDGYQTESIPGTPENRVLKQPLPLPQEDFDENETESEDFDDGEEDRDLDFEEEEEEHEEEEEEYDEDFDSSLPEAGKKRKRRELNQSNRPSPESTYHTETFGSSPSPLDVLTSVSESAAPVGTTEPTSPLDVVTTVTAKSKNPPSKKSKKKKKTDSGDKPSTPAVNNNFNLFVGKHQVSVVVLKHQGVGGKHPKEPGKFYYQARVRNEYPQRHIWSGWATREDVINRITSILHAKPSTKIETMPTQNPARKIVREVSSESSDDTEKKPEEGREEPTQLPEPTDKDSFPFDFLVKRRTGGSSESAKRRRRRKTTSSPGFSGEEEMSAKEKRLARQARRLKAMELQKVGSGPESAATATLLNLTAATDSASSNLARAKKPRYQQEFEFHLNDLSAPGQSDAGVTTSSSGSAAPSSSQYYTRSKSAAAAHATLPTLTDSTTTSTSTSPITTTEADALLASEVISALSHNPPISSLSTFSTPSPSSPGSPIPMGTKAATSRAKTSSRQKKTQAQSEGHVPKLAPVEYQQTPISSLVQVASVAPREEQEKSSRGPILLPPPLILPPAHAFPNSPHHILHSSPATPITPTTPTSSTSSSSVTLLNPILHPLFPRPASPLPTPTSSPLNPLPPNLNPPYPQATSSRIKPPNIVIEEGLAATNREGYVPSPTSNLAFPLTTGPSALPPSSSPSLTSGVPLYFPTLTPAVLPAAPSSPIHAQHHHHHHPPGSPLRNVIQREESGPPSSAPSSPRGKHHPLTPISSAPSSPLKNVSSSPMSSGNTMKRTKSFSAQFGGPNAPVIHLPQVSLHQHPGPYLVQQQLLHQQQLLNHQQQQHLHQQNPSQFPPPPISIVPPHFYLFPPPAPNDPAQQTHFRWEQWQPPKSSSTAEPSPNVNMEGVISNGNLTTAAPVESAAATATATSATAPKKSRKRDREKERERQRLRRQKEKLQKEQEKEKGVEDKEKDQEINVDQEEEEEEKDSRSKMAIGELLDKNQNQDLDSLLMLAEKERKELDQQ